MLRPAFPLLAAFLYGAALAGPTPAPGRAEIDALLERLQNSGCQFSRNGSWYSAADARGHLLRKLDYIEGQRTLKSTEQFIEFVASASSESGEAYAVRCGGGTPMQSREWLSKELTFIRLTTR